MTLDDLIEMIDNSDDFGQLKATMQVAIATESITSAVNKYEVPARSVLSHLHTLHGTKLKAIGKIAQRLSAGYSVNDLKRIAEVKCDEWGDEKTMAKYLRPQTLYGSRDKVNKYLDQVKLNDNFIKKQVAKTRPDSIVLPKFI